MYEGVCDSLLLSFSSMTRKVGCHRVLTRWSTLACMGVFKFLRHTPHLALHSSPLLQPRLCQEHFPLHSEARSSQKQHLFSFFLMHLKIA